MKLPDYSKALEVKRLLNEMGVSELPELPKIIFEKTERITRKHNNEDFMLVKTLLDSAVSVAGSEVSAGLEELLEYKGRKVVVYIKDQRKKIDFEKGVSDYRYHLFHCEALESMNLKNQGHRYLATQRSDGRFEVKDVRNNKQGLVKMELCGYCKGLLREIGQYSQPFDLKAFFEEHDSYIPDNYVEDEVEIIKEPYSPTEDDYLREQLKAAGYVCQMCYVDCAQEKELLCAHHLDDNPINNKSSNVRVLCIDCHSKYRNHQYILSTPDVKNQIIQIDELRAKQNIATLS